MAKTPHLGRIIQVARIPRTPHPRIRTQTHHPERPASRREIEPPGLMRIYLRPYIIDRRLRTSNQHEQIQDQKEETISELQFTIYHIHIQFILFIKKRKGHFYQASFPKTMLIQSLPIIHIPDSVSPHPYWKEATTKNKESDEDNENLPNKVCRPE